MGATQGNDAAGALSRGKKLFLQNNSVAEATNPNLSQSKDSVEMQEQRFAREAMTTIGMTQDNFYRMPSENSPLKLFD